MNVYRCEDCGNCVGHTCEAYMKDKDKAIYDCFKNQFKNYSRKTKKQKGINFK